MVMRCLELMLFAVQLVGGVGQPHERDELL